MSDDSAFETELNNLLGSLEMCSQTPDSVGRSAVQVASAGEPVLRGPGHSKERQLSQAEIDALLARLLNS